MPDLAAWRLYPESSQGRASYWITSGNDPPMFVSSACSGPTGLDALITFANQPTSLLTVQRRRMTVCFHRLLLLLIGYLITVGGEVAPR
ncbi:hypothetical protein BCR39DRAFT_104519 [Naematelia encephala]|uniref:Uncharacterized protein n=1 Tax=Naematelia encephala TaxID=71784 RepID=A0A1Y2B8N5_9TREE|nr:hypothetical protein BCR39DRAFT_104519 [Naematelia encephala]